MQKLISTRLLFSLWVLSSCSVHLLLTTVVAVVVLDSLVVGWMLNGGSGGKSMALACASAAAWPAPIPQSAFRPS